MNEFRPKRFSSGNLNSELLLRAHSVLAELPLPVPAFAGIREALWREAAVSYLMLSLLLHLREVGTVSTSVYRTAQRGEASCPRSQSRPQSQLRALWSRSHQAEYPLSGV